MRASIFLLCLFSVFAVYSQNLQGTIRSKSGAVPFANILLSNSNTNTGTTSNENGNFRLTNIPEGSYTLVVRVLGYTTYTQTLSIPLAGKEPLNIYLEENITALDPIVVTSTRTAKRRTDAPVIVNLIAGETLEKVNAITVSEGLQFQPGLRVETDCQTCSYTQLRINGLQGGYSQILINGRPIFSPLTGLYGMEQIPANMIERIEVVRGGVSALYGSSAIGGTVNIRTKTPKTNNYELAYTFQQIDGQTNDHILSGNATLVNANKNAGATFFVNRRTRGLYDANADNYSELPELKNNNFGANLFFLPNENQKLELSISSLNEYRYGGEQVDKAAHLTTQSEERTHHVLMGSADYEINFDKNSLIFYYGGQQTLRDHYTGIQPDNALELSAFLANPPYGTSKVSTHQGGTQYNHYADQFIGGKAVWSVGAEYIYDDVEDKIEAYNYLIDQTTRNLGAFIQNDWDISNKLNLLTGFRIDKHNLLDQAIVSPRVSLLYKNQNAQYRLGWGTGFRAPQAFDTDLHIAFAGGGISRISLAEDLKEERSNSFTASINYDKPSDHVIAGFTLEGFYTKLNDAFYQHPLGEDAFGERFEKRNGAGAIVQGITLEARANFNYILEIDAGITIQKSEYEEAVVNIDGLEAKKEFLRTPNTYGYATLSYTPLVSIPNLNITANYVYTGSMLMAHFGGENTGFDTDNYVESNAFSELSAKATYGIPLETIDTKLEVFAGIKNIFNAYQNDFDKGKNRDSNYIYGPSLPRTIYAGIKIKSL
ncbi:MAG: TonB-dependent receptor [Flavobacteriaceae bacterium]|nr:TonB-dependent receptor [Flavobacteriaceae bacterium]